jgi:general secretion pathway protein D
MILLLLSGCAAKSAYQRGQREMKKENYDAAVLAFSKASALDPGNTTIDVALQRAKINASAEHFDKGRRYADAKQWELAVAEYQQTLALNPSNEHAQVEMQKAIVEIQRRDLGPSEIEQLKERARRRDLAPPLLDPKHNIPILLNFQQVPVGKIFEALSKASGINFIYDEKVDVERPRTIDIGNVTLQKALDILMLQTKNFYKVIDEYTLLIAPDTRQKRQEYEDQVIRTFFLSNADTKTVVTLLRSLLQSRQIAENPDLNSVTIKDTPSKVLIGERIINANDKSKGEVLIDVELLEINRTTAVNAGIDLSSKPLSLTFGGGDASVPLHNLDVLKQPGNWPVGVIPSVIISFLKADSDTKVVAKPQLRVSEGERAEILIGDRVPIPTTSFNTSQTVGGNIVPITSFTYQNVGITVQIEPRVHHNKEVTLQVQVEISQVTGVVDTGAQAQPIIGTRQINTVIRLRDGETNLLAGLISSERQNNRSGVIGISDIPGLGTVLSSNDVQKRSVDIIMTLTPRIIRIPDITEEDLLTLWVGTEENMQLRGPSQSAYGAGPFGPPTTSAVAALDSQQPVVPEVSTSDRPVPRAGSTSVGGAQQPPPRAQPTPPPQPATGTTPSGAAAVPGGEPQAEAAGGDPAAGDQPAGPASIRMVPSATSYRVGDTVVVQVVIENAAQVASTPFHLRYNSEVLQFLPPGIEGPFMGADGANTVFLAGDLGGGGEVVVGLSRMGGSEGASGSGTLATFQFQAINPGDCGFAFTAASVKDPQARNLPASFAPASVTVEP